MFQHSKKPYQRINDIEYSLISIHALLKTYEQITHEISINMNLVRSDLSVSMPQMSVIPSTINAMAYRLNEFQQNIIQLQSNLNNIQNMNHVIDPLIGNVNSMNSEIINAFESLNDSVYKMQSIVGDFNQIANDSSISRTIEDLKEIGNRFS